MSEVVFISAIYDPARDVGLAAKAFPDGDESDAYLAWADETYDPALESIEMWTTQETFVRLYPWSKAFLAPAKA